MLEIQISSILFLTCTAVLTLRYLGMLGILMITNQHLRLLFYVSELDPRESNQVGTDSETSTCASRSTHTGSIDIKNGEGGSRNEGDHSNLGNLEGLTGENERGNRNGETLQEILHEASHEVGHINAARRSGLGL